MKKEILYIFAHLHKTGGTTLNKHIAKNFKKEEVLFLYYDKLKLDPFTHKKQDYKKLAEKAILRLSKKDRDKIRVISGHFIPHGIHKYFDPNKEVRYITIIRNPFERTKSFYNYFRTLYEKEDRDGKNKKLYKSFLKINDKIPNFETWINNKFGNIKGSIIPQPVTKYFSDLGYKLSDFYFIGITEKLDKDLSFLFHLLGIKKFFINQNISIQYAEKNLSEIRGKYNKKYKQSVKLYEKATILNENFKKTNKDFSKIVKEINLKRKIFTPFTQIIFDFMESLRMLSSYLRKHSKLYGKVWDTLKQQL